MEGKSIFERAREQLEERIQGKPEAYQYYVRSYHKWGGSQKIHVYHILDSVKSPEEIPAILEFLCGIDWNKLCEGASLSRQYEIEETVKAGGGFCERCKDLVRNLIPASIINQGEKKLCWDCFNKLQDSLFDNFDDTYHFCRECSKITQGRFLSREHPVLRLEGWHCQDCIKEKEEAIRITCPLCGTTTIDHVDPNVCNDCYRREPQEAHIAHHLARARSLGLPATLTLTQWAAAVEHFNHKCAYCSRPYTLLEHYIPLSAGEGGTTAGNCVPACSSCNSRKGSSLPDRLHWHFPTDNLARIREWLSSQVA